MLALRILWLLAVWIFLTAVFGLVGFFGFALAYGGFRLYGYLDSHGAI